MSATVTCFDARLVGTLLGTAVGDALGLPREGLSARRAGRIFGGSSVSHRLVFGRGMLSDDTEHTCMVAQALLASGGDPRRFARSLAWRLRFWLLAIPAGMGLATLKANLKLWIGFPPTRSGVWSAGNGPAMRAAVIGAWAAAHQLDGETLAAIVRTSTRITHTDPKALEGAMAIAHTAREAAELGWTALRRDSLWDRLMQITQGEQLRGWLTAARDIEARGGTLADLCAAMNSRNGVSGYINHTVPAAIFCCVRHNGDFRAAVESAVRAGGDTDTLASIVGGLCGSAAGDDAIPREWIAGVLDWPRSVPFLRRLGHVLAQDGGKPLWLLWPAIPLRNLLFLLIVLAHGFRRLLPPY